MVEEPLHEFDLPFRQALEHSALSVLAGQEPPQVDPDKVPRLRRSVRDVVLAQPGGRPGVCAREAGAVQGEVGRETDRVEEQVRPEDVLTERPKSRSDLSAAGHRQAKDCRNSPRRSRFS